MAKPVAFVFAMKFLIPERSKKAKRVLSRIEAARDTIVNRLGQGKGFDGDVSHMADVADALEQIAAVMSRMNAAGRRKEK